MRTSKGIELLACETCGGRERDPDGRTNGERLLQALHDARDSEGLASATISGVRCLWACDRSCAVHIRSPNRAGYVLCDLTPTAESARALIAYLRLYADSDDGAVPYREWPLALRGHFLCRTPIQPLHQEAVAVDANDGVAPTNEEER